MRTLFACLLLACLQLAAAFTAVPAHSLAAARASTITSERACFCIIYYKTSPSPSPDALIATKSRPLAAC